MQCVLITIIQWNKLENEGDPEFIIVTSKRVISIQTTPPIPEAIALLPELLIKTQVGLCSCKCQWEIQPWTSVLAGPAPWPPSQVAQELTHVKRGRPTLCSTDPGWRQFSVSWTQATWRRPHSAFGVWGLAHSSVLHQSSRNILWGNLAMNLRISEPHIPNFLFSLCVPYLVPLSPADSLLSPWHLFCMNNELANAPWVAGEELYCQLSSKGSPVLCNCISSSAHCFHSPPFPLKYEFCVLNF